jgi:putative toxin-antitoxin system antitoxin component (TIGR02293 family)
MFGAFHDDADPYRSILGVKANSPKAIMKVIRAGLPYTTVKFLQDILELSRNQVATVLHISFRTLERRKKSGKLDSIESDRAFRLVRVFLRACELYEGDQEAARKWLKRKNAALEGLAPEEMIETEVGAVLVENLIGRLENGVFS